MAVTRLNIQNREPYAGGVAFGETGAYERIDGIIEFAVEPEHVANHAIVDLDRAKRDADGRVHFRADICLLVPAEPRRGNQRLFLELPNRGRKLANRQINYAPAEPAPTANIDPGDGFLFRHGYTVGWIGWQWDVIRSDALMGLQPPEAVENGQPISGQTVVRFQANDLHYTHLLADRVHQPYPAADVDDPNAVLTVRDFAVDEPRVIPRDEWRFARESAEGVVPDHEHFYLSTGFQPGKVYELVYTTNRCPVVGAGLLAVRDTASFLRYSTAEDNPCAGSIERAYGFGISQTGRMLRHFLYLGLNLDEEGRMVFDGLIPHVAGARRGEFNHRFGQPSVQNTPGFGHRFPFADEVLSGPDDLPPDGLLKRQRELGGVPKIIYSNSSAEYWRGDCALLHIDPSGDNDLEAAPESRIYYFAGTQHGPGDVQPVRVSASDGSRGRNDFNSVDYTPLLRAVLVNLDRWVSDGIEPPPSAHPRLADNTAVPYSTLLKAIQEFPGIYIPDRDRLPRIRRVDLGPEVDTGIGHFPVVEGEAYPAFVAAVDADGNELGGIRLPDLTVPVGTHTGWNPRDPGSGAPEQIIPMQGATLFFCRDERERLSMQDPRPSIAARYPGRDAYIEAVASATRQLTGQGYILQEDVNIVIQNAAERYDQAMTGVAIAADSGE